MGIGQKKSFLGLLLILCAYTLFPADFGVVGSFAAEYDSSETGESSLTGLVSPWVSALFSPRLSLYVSAALSAEYGEYRKKTQILFEMDRTELSWRASPKVFLQFGRQRFRDDVGLIASGLFDGLQGSFGLGPVRLSLGALYTGLLYKETAKILMNGRDAERYAMAWDSSDLSAYFASRRMLLPLTVAFPALSGRSSLVLNGIAQFDMNGAGADTLHSQYLELSYRIDPLDPLHLTIAGVGGLSERPDLGFGFAAFIGADWEPPAAVQDLLSLELRWSSGRVDDTLGAYLPVSGISVGEIYTPRFSGLLYAGTAYTVRLVEALSIKMGAGYFIRTDLETLQDEFKKDAYTLGGELFGSLVWAPQSAISISAGGGAFIPGMGSAFGTNDKVRSKARLGMMISF
ncbi:hypothetical protein FACS1894137_15200 [Spirochaetia bacterium]|nr:hypothetical protein FACS1894137_15200 [Spirochaetia bacterium]